MKPNPMLRPQHMGRHFAIPMAVLVVAAAAAWLLISQPAAAQSSITPDQINAVAKELWCPLCNGVRLDNCDLQACVQMREQIGQQLAGGKSKDEIKAYFVQQYGDVVLGMPTDKGLNLLTWLLPVLIAVIGLGWVAYFVATWVRKRPAPVRAQSAAAGAAPGKAPAGGQPAAAGDDYLQRVDEELKKYE